MSNTFLRVPGSSSCLYIYTFIHTSWPNYFTHLVEGKAICIEDVVESIVGIKTGLGKCGNHDASPRATSHNVCTLTAHRHTHTNTLLGVSPSRLWGIMSECVFIHSYRVLWVFICGRSLTPSWLHRSIILWAFLFTLSRSTSRAGEHSDDRASSCITTALEHRTHTCSREDFSAIKFLRMNDLKKKEEERSNSAVALHVHTWGLWTRGKN